MLEKRNSRNVTHWLWFYLLEKIHLFDFDTMLWQI